MSSAMCRAASNCIQAPLPFQQLLQDMEIKTNLVIIGFPLCKWMGKVVVKVNTHILCTSLNCEQVQLLKLKISVLDVSLLQNIFVV